jgi:expansin (peptidoglycan-binding protein)
VTAEQHDTPHRARALSPRWLAAGGGAVLAAVAGVALLLQNTTSAACAAPPTGNTVRTGKATFYDLGGGKGNCSFPSAPANDLFVALGNSQYSAGAACGSYLDVTGPKGKVRVKVIDRCPECAAGHLDLSRTAFKKIADEVQGIIPVKYKAVVNPATPGPLSVRFADTSTRWWFAVLIDNHANPLTSVKVKGPGRSSRSAQHMNDNHWVINADVGTGPFSLTFTDAYGHTGTATGVKLRPGRVQTTSVRLTGKAPAAAAAAAAAPAAAAPGAAAAKKAKKPRPATPSAATRSSAPAAPVLESTVPPTEPALALAAAAPSCG